MKLLVLFLAGILVGGVGTYILLDKNAREITEPVQELASGLQECDVKAQIAQDYSINPKNVSTVRIYLNLSRQYFTCVKEVYNYT